MTSTNVDVVLELEIKKWNGAGSKSDDTKFDLTEIANSSDGYMQIHDRCFTYLVNLAKIKRVAYFMPTWGNVGATQWKRKRCVRSVTDPTTRMYAWGMSAPYGYNFDHGRCSEVWNQKTINLMDWSKPMREMWCRLYTDTQIYEGTDSTKQHWAQDHAAHTADADRNLNWSRLSMMRLTWATSWPYRLKGLHDTDDSFKQTEFASGRKVDAANAVSADGTNLKG